MTSSCISEDAHGRYKRKSPTNLSLTFDCGVHVFPHPSRGFLTSKDQSSASRRHVLLKRGSQNRNPVQVNSHCHKMGQGILVWLSFRIQNAKWKRIKVWSEQQQHPFPMSTVDAKKAEKGDRGRECHGSLSPFLFRNCAGVQVCRCASESFEKWTQKRTVQKFKRIQIIARTATLQVQFRF